MSDVPIVVSIVSGFNTVVVELNDWLIGSNALLCSPGLVSCWVLAAGPAGAPSCFVL